MNDIDLAKAIARGNAEAMEAFVQAHYASVLRFMRHLTRRIEDAEDLTQSAFLTARRQAHTFKGRSSLKTWLHRVAFHEYTHWKRSQRKTEQLSPMLARSEPGFTALIHAESLLYALHELPAAHRETFLLFEVQELTLQEVAQVLGKPVGTIKSRLNTARQLLRESLADQERDHKINGETAIETN